VVLARVLLQRGRALHPRPERRGQIVKEGRVGALQGDDRRVGIGCRHRGDSGDLYAGPPATAVLRAQDAPTAAEVNGVPLWKRTPWRRWNVCTLWSAELVQLAARAGMILAVVVSRAYLTSPSYTLVVMFSPEPAQ
jgi:hypothetical protein